MAPSVTPAPESPLASLPAAGSAHVLVDGLDHPEGVCWDPVRSCFYAGGEAGQIYRVDAEAGSAEQLATAPGFVLGLAVDGRGRVIVCASSHGSLCVWDPEGPGTEAVPFLEQVDGEPLGLPNVAAFAPDGTLYASASGTWGRDDGRLVALHPDGEARTLSREPCHFTNGLAVSPDGRRLWCAESYDPVLSVFDLGERSPRREVVHRFTGCVLDGLAMTEDGGLLITCYRPDRIYHLDASGRLEVVAQDPQGTLLAAPTNAAFGGPELDVLVVANLGRWHLTLLELGLRGAPLHRPQRWALDAIGAP